MLGGLTVSCADGGRVRAIRLAVPADLRFVVLVPDAESATREARAVLPAEVPRADAVFNIQRVSLLLAGLAAGRTDLLGEGMQDRLHQPYRLRLFPWMDEVIASAQKAGAFGCALSGAGPSMLAVARADTADSVARAMESALAGAGLAGRALSVNVAADGATWART